MYTGWSRVEQATLIGELLECISVTGNRLSMPVSCMILILIKVVRSITSVSKYIRFSSGVFGNT